MMMCLKGGEDHKLFLVVALCRVSVVLLPCKIGLLLLVVEGGLG